MVDRHTHARQAASNGEFLLHAKLCNPPKLDWLVTVAFYEAIHLVEEVFAVEDPASGHSTSHGDRWDRLVRDPKFSGLRRHYNRLREASRIARYLTHDGKGDFTCFEQYADQPTVDDLLDKSLPNIRSCCVGLIRKAAPASSSQSGASPGEAKADI